jgi:integrase
MSGSLQVKGKYYYAVLSIKDENGKNKTKWVSLKISAERGNKRKAETELKRVINEYETRDGVNYTDVLFCDYLKQWLEEHRPNITQGSYEGYINFLDKHIYPYYSDLAVKLFDLKPLHIQKYYGLKIGKDGKKGLTANTLKKHHSIVRKCLQHALQMNLILFNPADRVTLPRIVRYHGRAYDVEQAKKLLEASKGEAMEVPVFLALQFGLRRSEVLGLLWEAVDFDNGVIHIRRTVIRSRSIIVREGTKNKSSTRTLPMLGESKKYLQAIKAKQEEEKRLCGADYDDSGYVCRWADGKPFNPSYLSHSFKRLVMRLGLPLIRYHDLRHSAASILVSVGCNVKEVSVFLGHNQISTTLDIYAHLFNSSSVELMRKYDTVLSGTGT